MNLPKHIVDQASAVALAGETPEQTLERALKLLKRYSAKRDYLIRVLAEAERELDRGEGIDGEELLEELRTRFAHG